MTYGFQTNYYKGATNPKGETWFVLNNGEFEFNALNFEYLVVSGAKAQFKGLGKMIRNGVEQSGVAFVLTVIDGQLTGGGGTDKIRMKIFNKSTGEIFYDNQPGASDADAPVTVVENNLAGDGIVVVNTSTTTATRAAAPIVVTPVTPAEPTIQPITLTAYPNPTSTFFRLKVAGGATEKVQLRVFDQLGRMVHLAQGGTNQTYEFGQKFTSGSYFAQVVVGEKATTLKLIKNK
jgi:hypothetical protein